MIQVSIKTISKRTFVVGVYYPCFIRASVCEQTDKTVTGNIKSEQKKDYLHTHRLH